MASPIRKGWPSALEVAPEARGTPTVPVPSLVIEHDMEFIGRICDPVICMAEGKVLAQGTLDQIKANEQVIEAYLGTGLKNKDQVGVSA